MVKHNQMDTQNQPSPLEHNLVTTYVSPIPHFFLFPEVNHHPECHVYSSL